MNTTQKAILLDLFHKNAKAKATGKFKEAEEIEADFLNVLNALTFEARKERLEEEIDNLKERLFKDTAGGASTFLHYAREHLNGLWERKRLLFEMGAIDIDEEDYLQDKLKEIQAEIFKRLQGAFGFEDVEGPLEKPLFRQTTVSGNRKGGLMKPFETH